MFEQVVGLDYLVVCQVFGLVVQMGVVVMFVFGFDYLYLVVVEVVFVDVCDDVGSDVVYRGVVFGEDVDVGVGVVMVMWCVEGVGDLVWLYVVYWYCQLCGWWYL